MCPFYAALAPQVATLPSVDRVGLISDAFSLAIGGYSSTTAALDLLQNYISETQSIVWSEIDQR
jgi:hypothetical protein